MRVGVEAHAQPNDEAITICGDSGDLGWLTSAILAAHQLDVLEKRGLGRRRKV